MIKADMGRHEAMSPAPAEQEADVHQGEKYLGLLDLGHLADAEIPGHGKKARDFLDICGDHALPALERFAGSTPADPMYTDATHPDYLGMDYAQTRAALQGIVMHYVNPPTQES